MRIAFRVPKTTRAARAVQERLRSRVVRRGSPRARWVAGADVSELAGVARAAVVLTRDLAPVEDVVVERPIPFPYVPGLLSFREIPSLLACFRRLRGTPDVVIMDGQGIAHPRRLGIAAHLGLCLDRPTIGCAKSRLVGTYEEPAQERGAWTPLRHEGETIGAVLRTQPGRPVLFVSVGHRVSLAAAIRIVLDCAPARRLPEPQRLADRLSKARMGA